MATANSVMQSTEPTTDELSPTSIILNALRKSGQQPTNENIRRYVEAMARQPNESGTDIPGLRIGTPSSEADDQAAMAAARGGDRKGSVATKIESVTTPPDKTPPTDTSKTTSAAPTDDGGLSPDYYLGATGNEAPSGLGALILGGGAAGGAGAYGLNKLRNWGLGSGAGPKPDPGAAVAPPAPTAMAEPPVSPMTAALNEATAPRTGAPSVGDSVSPMPDIGPVPPPRPMGPTSPVLPADLGAPPPQTIPSGPNTQVRPANMPENAPRLPMPNRVNAPPTPADFYHPSWRTLGPLARSILGHVR